MSGLITQTVTISGVNGTRKQDFKPGRRQVTQSENRGIDQVQNIGTAAGGEAIVFGDMSALPQMVCFENLDPTNYVEIGRVISATFEPFLVVNPGAIAGPVRPAAGTTWYAKAHTGACDLRVCAYAP